MVRDGVRDHGAVAIEDAVVADAFALDCQTFAEFCGGPVSSDRLFGFLSEKIIQFVVAEAVEM